MFDASPKFLHSLDVSNNASIAFAAFGPKIVLPNTVNGWCYRVALVVFRPFNLFGPKMTKQVLEPASEVEAEMAATATACLVKALDHSKADHIKITLEFDDGKGDPPVLHVPPRALRFFADVLRQMAQREPMILFPHKAEMTTQEVAGLLNVSRPFVIKEIEAGTLKCRMVNKHRRILFEEVMRYQAAQKEASEQALRQVSAIAQEIGQEL